MHFFFFFFAQYPFEMNNNNITNSLKTHRFSSREEQFQRCVSVSIEMFTICCEDGISEISGRDIAIDLSIDKQIVSKYAASSTKTNPCNSFLEAVCACIEIRNGFFQMDRIECARCDLGRWCSNIFNLIAQMQCIEARKFWCIIIFNTICVQINGQDVRLRWWRWRQAIVIITMMLQIIIACELLRVRGGALRTRSSALISYCCYINIEACGEHRAHTKRTEHTVWSAFSHSLTHSIERRQY